MHESRTGIKVNNISGADVVIWVVLAFCAGVLITDIAHDNREQQRCAEVRR